MLFSIAENQEEEKEDDDYNPRPSPMFREIGKRRETPANEENMNGFNDNPFR
jgi:hypothetical protein